MRKRDELKKSNMKRYADNKQYVKPSQLQLGDAVLVRQQKTNKLSTPYKISCFQHLFSTCAARTVFSIVRINRSDSAFVFGHKGVILSKIKKTVRAAQVENKCWKQEIFKFLRNYRATPHCTTEKSPYETLFDRKMKIKIPTAIDIVEDDSLMRKRDELKKSNMKRYADNKQCDFSVVQCGVAL
jgi:hypothetical protein